MGTAISFPSLLQQFFTDRLIKQRQASPHTIASYRDTFRLLLRFAQSRLGRSPDRLEFDQIDAPLIGAFLDDLEKGRHIAARTRNLRLTAIRSFFRYAAYETPAHADQIQRVLAMPPKRWTRAHVAFLTRPEIDALLCAPDQQTWSGRRDHALLLVAVQTGLRLSEITGLQRKDVNLDTGAHVRVIGKGRKERVTPLMKNTVGVLRPWLRGIADHDDTLLFPSSRGDRLSHDAVQYLLAKYVASARTVCPSLVSKRVTPHVLRHTAAMELLQAGVGRTVIAMFLGHESIETTQVYLDANLAMKEAALGKIASLKGKPGRYRPDGQLMAFLKSL